MKIASGLETFLLIAEVVSSHHSYMHIINCGFAFFKVDLIASYLYCKLCKCHNNKKNVSLGSREFSMNEKLSQLNSLSSIKVLIPWSTAIYAYAAATIHHVFQWLFQLSHSLKSNNLQPY